MNRFSWLLASFVGTLALCGCEIPDPISNGDLDAWCGDTPCGWEATGGIKRVSTWHANDYAVSFERNGAQLSQVNSELSSFDCLSFSMVAKVSRAELAWVELDFFNDGSIDWKKPIPPGDFRQLEFAVHAPTSYDGVRFIVRRAKGQGEMVLAGIHAKAYGTCSGDQVELSELPGGARCDTDDNCASDACVGGHCVGCASDDDCEDDEVCGYAPVGSRGFIEYATNVLPQCIAPSTRPIGELCLGDAECESGVCCEGACSECCGEDSCDNERTCRRGLAGDGEGSEVIEPFLCSAGERSGAAGDLCTTDDECEVSCVDLQCTGLCLPISGGDINERCAMLECDEASCDFTCGVETVEVGRCD
jgi:hypothetical protein